MRQRPQRRFDEAFKRDALLHLERTDRTLPQVARDLGMSVQTLRSWYNAEVAKKRKPGKSPKVTPAPTAAETLEEENARLKRALAASEKRVSELEEDREILKKAAAFFARESE